MAHDLGMHWPAATLASVPVLVATLMANVLLTVGCSENVYEGTSRGDVCDVAGTAPVWWILVVTPALAVFVVVLLTKGLARWFTVAAVLVIAATIEAILLAIVTSNLFA